MRKSSAAVLAICLALLSASAAHADELFNDTIKVTGTYSQAATGAPDGTIAVTKSLKMGDLLTLLGIDPAMSLKIYWDSTTYAFVLAEPGIADGADVVPTATICTFGSDYIQLNKSAKKNFEAGAVTVMNDVLHGSYKAATTIGAHKTVTTDTVVAYGVLDNKDTIINLTVKDTYPNL